MEGVTRRFFARRVKKYRESELEIARALKDLFFPRSVYDAGCGIGSYLEGFAACGCEIAGCELHWDLAKEYAAPCVRDAVCSHDLSTPLHVDRHDLVLCIEVAEHLPPEAAATLTDNLQRACGGFVVMTAAVPGQRGHGHINCQPPEYWREKMRLQGMEYSDAMTEYVREAIAVNKLGKSLGRSLSVFR